METFYQLDRRGQSAIISMDYPVALGILQDNPAWGAEVMELAGAKRWRVRVIRWLNRWIPSRIDSREQNRFTAFGVAGRCFGLTYQVERSGEGAIRVTPLGVLDPRLKIATAIVLTIMGLWPLLLAPLVWMLLSSQNRWVSRRYLDAFCRYLHQLVDRQKTKPASVRA